MQRHSQTLYTAAIVACGAVLIACHSPDASLKETTTSSTGLLPFEQRPAEDDIIYFLITDRFENGDTDNDQGGLSGGKLTHGFDPTDEKFYHGGDLRGVTNRLDYLEDLGVTAIWITPIFGNRPIQQFGPWLTASYHGYWIADFMNVDAHLGTADDLRALIDAAHKRDIKIILDIVVNHTAHVIKYRECHDPDYVGPGKEGPADACVYRSSDDYPDTAYTPYIDEQNLAAKNPDWLNDPAYYHNRGELSYTGEASYWGDFSGLDDVYTEHPRVVEGMIEIFQYWIQEFGIDGFRIDTAGHVNPSFFSQFAPAMQRHAATNGRTEFMIFGEVADTVLKHRTYVTKGKLPAVLYFDFRKAVIDYVVNAGSAQQLANFFEEGDYLIDHDTSPYQLPTFIGNHDDGRIGVQLKKVNPDASDEDNVQRSALAHAILYFARGIPILYYGDEQGFFTDPGFHESREDMFPSITASYNDNDLIGTDRTTADSNFDREHPLYREISRLSEIYREHAALRRGDQITRYAENGPGIFAFSRIHAHEGIEFLVLVNNSSKPAAAIVPVAAVNADWTQITGSTTALSQRTDSVAVTLAPLSFAIFRADTPLPVPEIAGDVAFTGVDDGDLFDCSGFVEASPDDELTHVEFSIAVGDGSWQSLGVDRDPPFRSYVDVADYLPGADVVIRARTAAYALESAEATVNLRIGNHQERCQ